jgi:hypothetical protein
MPKLKLKSELEQDPNYSGGDNAIGSSVKPCPLKENPERKRIKEVFFANKDGEKITTITKEEKVDLVIKTQNMSGEEVMIDLPEIASSFKLSGEQVTDGKVIVHNIGSDEEKVELEIVPTKVLVTPVPRIGRTSGGEVAVEDDEEVAEIVCCDFCHGPNDEILQGDATQFVNLPRESKWVDNDLILNKDRLGYKPWIKVQFSKQKACKFFLKLLPEDSNIDYTETEKNRNSKFKYLLTEKEYTTGTDGVLIIKDFALSVAGGDKFKVEARDENDKKAISQGTLITKRLVYTVEHKMKTLTTTSPDIDQVKKEYKRSGIVLKSLTAKKMGYIQNISTEDSDAFKQKARTAFDASDGKDKQKYCLAIAYTDHLAVKVSDKSFTKTNVKVGEGESKAIFMIKGPGLTNTDVKHRGLWRKIVTDEDWYVSCVYKSNAAGATKVTIVKAKCTPVQKSGYATGYMDKVEIDVSHLPKGTGTIKLKVNWIDRMRAGLAFGGNLVCVCTKAWWRTSSADKQQQVIVHEIGHKVQMASNGTGISPDKIATHYENSKGHVGNHCYKGNADDQDRYDSSTDKSNSTCVMYGSTNGKIEFCDNCQPAVQKVDITNGWTDF